MAVSQEVLDQVALSQDEYSLIVEKLGREPNIVELGMFGSLWSEHCGYKHSKLLLRTLPSRSKKVLSRAGEENAGVVNLGDGIVVVMKMESHNHPSAIEPFQGAATGVGGIVRDIFTMGAYPIALLNSLRFGPLSEQRNRYLFNGVVGGIASYGNCLGIPDVAGEIFYAPCYSANPLVNAMCVGIARSDRLVTSSAGAPGNLLMLVGADTGKDGLHGASGLASRTFEQERELRPAVQVGNPFLEKLLIEACYQLAQTDWIVGMQDLGDAGLTRAASESDHRAGAGLDIDVTLAPRREEGMTPYEVMLSESQERMLVIVKPGFEDRVKALFDQWELDCTIIGRVTGDGIARIREGERIAAEVPVRFLNEPPLYRTPCRKPAWLTRVQRQPALAADLEAAECGRTLLDLLASPNIASKEHVYRQYDHQVHTNTVVPPGSDAAVLRLKESRRGIALTTDGNGRYCYLDPYIGAAIAVAEAARNLVCSGARPLALTDCLNFGNPEKPDIYYQLKECVRGMSRACRRLDVPIISGNVSLYNETRGVAVYPTPVIGMIGLLEDVERHCTMAFKEAGDIVYLLGEQQCGGLAGSEYMDLKHATVAGRPHIDLDLEKRVQACCLALAQEGRLSSAHDCSDGGLGVALAESCIAGGQGFMAEGWPTPARLDELLFGELQSRIVISVPAAQAGAVEGAAARQRAPLRRLGVVRGSRLVIPGLVDLPVSDMEAAWRINAL